MTVLRRSALVVAAVAAAGFVHLAWRPPSLCLLRTLTGVPCPFCGGTTSAVDLAHGDVAAAFRASLIAPLMLLAWPLAAAPVPALSRWRTAAAPRWVLLGVALAAAELWQLVRFGIVGA